MASQLVIAVSLTIGVSALCSILEAMVLSVTTAEIEQFKKTNDFSELVRSIKTMNIKNTNFDDFKDLKNVEGHVIESMIKRFFDNA